MYHFQVSRVRPHVVQLLVIFLCIDLSGVPLFLRSSAVWAADPSAPGQGGGGQLMIAGQKVQLPPVDTSVIGASPSLTGTSVSNQPPFNFAQYTGDITTQMQAACSPSAMFGTGDLATGLGVGASLGSSAVQAMGAYSAYKNGGSASDTGNALRAMGMNTCPQSMAATASLEAAINGATTTAMMPGSNLGTTQVMGSQMINQNCGPSQANSAELAPISCENASSAEDLSRLVEERKKSLELVLCGAECKRSQLRVIQNQVQCLKMQANVLNQMGTQIGQAFKAEYDYASQQGLAFKADIQNREMQGQNLDIILKGQEGTPGLIARREKTLSLVNNVMPQKIAEINELLSDVDNKKMIIDSALQQRTMASAMNCFSQTPIGKYQCVPGGPPVSAKEYLNCRVKQTATLGAGNVVEQGAIQQKRAQAQEQSLNAVLSQIESNTPNDPNAPLEGGVGQKGPTGGAMNQTPKDVMNNFGGQLKGFNVGGATAYEFVGGALGYCYGLARKNINQAKRNQSSDIYQATFKQNQSLLQLEANVKSSLSDYTQNYSQNLQSMTGKSVAVDSFQCSSKNVSQRTDCIRKSVGHIENMRKSLETQLNNEKMTMVVKGTRANFPVVCQGLLGCVTALNTAKQSIQTDKQNLMNTKENFSKAEFLRAQGFAAGAGQALSQASAVLRARLNAMNAAMNGLGIGGTVDASPMRGEPLRPNPDTGFEMPKGGLEGIASYVQPPLPDLANPRSLNTPEGLGEQMLRANESMNRVQSAIAELSYTQSRCTAGAVRGVVSRLGLDLSGAGSCYATEYCKGNNLQEMQSSIAEINRVSMRSGGMYSRNSSPYSSGGFRSSEFSGSGASLNTGLSVMCSPSVPGVYTEPGSEISQAGNLHTAGPEGFHAHGGGYNSQGGYVNIANCRAAQMSITEAKSFLRDLAIQGNSSVRSRGIGARGGP